jgi:hypothetical protein
MIRIHLNGKYVNPFHPELDEVMEKWFNWLERQKPRKRGTANGVIWIEIDYLLVNEFNMLGQYDDAKVEYFNPFLKIAEADFDNEIPEGLPNRMTAEEWDYTDPENPVLITPSRVKTWREWQIGNIIPELIEGFWYVRSSYGNTNGASLKYDEMLILQNSSDVEFVDSKPIDEEQIVLG